MSMRAMPSEVKMIPVDQVDVLNSRERNQEVFEEIVHNIKSIGLKKPISVTPICNENGERRYRLICGEGRLNAFRILGETHIPALVVEATEEDAFVMSLAENIARRQYRPLEILMDIVALKERGYSNELIVKKTGLSAQYVSNIMFLLERGEERLIDGVQKGHVPLSTAVEIAKAGANDKNLGEILQKAYEDGKLRGRQLIAARKLLEKRRSEGTGVVRDQITVPHMTTSHLVRSFQSEVARKRKMVIKAEYSENKLILIIEAVRRLFRDEHFMTLLRAEGLDTLPAALAEKI